MGVEVYLYMSLNNSHKQLCQLSIAVEQIKFSGLTQLLLSPSFEGQEPGHGWAESLARGLTGCSQDAAGGCGHLGAPWGRLRV